MKKMILMAAVLFAVNGIASLSPAETECRKKATDAFKATQDAQKKAQAECKTKKDTVEKNKCHAGVVSAMKAANQKREADFKACRPAPAAKPKK